MANDVRHTANLIDDDAAFGTPIDDFSHCGTGECRVNTLPVLYRLNHVVSESSDLGDALRLILDIMRTSLRMDRGIITLYDRRSDTIYIHDSFGLTDEERRRGIYAPGEGITGKVVESGQAIVVPRLSESTDFLNRTQASESERRAKAAFICVPIMLGRKVLGTIAGERVYRSRPLLKQDAEFIAAVALMIAPLVELYLIANVDKVALETENLRLRNALKERYQPANIIGTSKPMLEVYELIRKVSSSPATVLILGESGVGKELVAGAIHYSSPVSDGPFVKFNCAAIPENLAESGLFGHEKGAFTGALAAHKGSFEQADGGTIFLDEVGELTLAVQAKLLRVLQERVIERVGGSRPLKVDVRIIAATNRDLTAMVERSEFREDLYYRLNVVPITVPPLRDRDADVILLADHFVQAASRRNAKSIKRISTPALNMLMAYHWPGNVRELENAIERAVILSDDDVIHGYNLPPSLQTPAESGTAFGVSLENKIHAVEYEMIVEALKNSGGNVGVAAGELGLTRRMLGLRMERYGISYKTYRTGTPRPPNR